MLLNPENETPSTVYSTMVRAIAPRPIAWVSTISARGITNLAPFSYFNGVSTTPAALMFSAVNKPDGSKKDTIRNIEANREFVVNVVPFDLRQPMATTASEFDYEVSEFEKVGLDKRTSHLVTPPAVKESPINFECELIQIVNVGQGPLAAYLVIGKIRLIVVSESVLTDGKIDPEKVDAIGRLGGREYCRTSQRFTIST